MDGLNLLKRKITATFVVTIVISIILAFLTINGMKDDAAHGLGADFLGWFAVFVMYAGAIILVYGNLVSVGIEYLQQKGYIIKTWVCVLLHSVMGLAFGLLFPGSTLYLALYGMGAAFLYALMDRWLYKRIHSGKRVSLFYIAPVIVCGIFWGYFQSISEPLPPFTADDAVERVTEGNGAPTAAFPSEIGQNEDQVGDYHVERVTAAEKVENDTYLVTFTETWENDEEKGSYEISYEVDRHSLTARDLRWEETPPYYEG